jgi:hypothetical protein
VLLEVALVILLRAPERAGVGDLGDDRPAQMRLHRGQRGLGSRPLRGGVHEDRRPVLRTEVEALTVHLGWVVLVPEHGEQLVVAHPLGVVLDLDRLGMAGAAAADGAVVGTVHGAAGVADSGRNDAVDLHEGVLDVPETPGCEGGPLCHGALSSFSRLVTAL